MKKFLLFFFASFVAYCTSTGQIITTIAGGGTVGLGDGGDATACELNHPIGIAVDASGSIYIGDRDNHRIRKISTSGIVTTIAGTGSAGFSGENGPATDAKIYAPYGLCIDISGNIYFTDNGNSRIRKISTSGIITTIAGGGTSGLGDGGPATNAELYGPAGVVVDAVGNVYISDGANSRVRRVNVAGIITTIAGGGSATSDGIPATTALLGTTYSIAVDGDANIYVGEQTKSRIMKITPAGIITTVAGTGTPGYNGDNIAATAAQLKGVFGIALDSYGNLYIGDGHNNRIRKVSTTGIISTIAGTGTAGYFGDAAAAYYAQVSTPAGVALSPSGNLYIADFGNDRIRSISNVVSIETVSEKENEISFYPNPSNGNFIVNLSSGFNETYVLLVTNILGQKITEMHGITNEPLSVGIDASNGLYLVSIQIANRTISRKISILK